MATKWKVGDVVQLKSGGEVMTVIRVNADEVTVTWQVGGKRQDTNYPADAVQALPNYDDLDED